jgi:lipopolysaccharide transport system permease protein
VRATYENASGAIAGGNRGAAAFYYLLCALVARELKGQYRRSLLGPLWALAQPLALLLLFLLMRAILSIHTGEVPYALFAYAGLVPWTLFANCISRATLSVYTNGPVVKKMALHPEVFPLSAAVTALVDACIALALLLGLALWYGIAPGLHLLWLAPLLLFTALLGAGFGLIAAAFGTYHNDTGFLLTPALQFWMFATPIMYPAERIPEGWRMIYYCNPMAGLVESFRAVVIHGEAPLWPHLTAAFCALALVWGLGWPFFRRMARYFADVL